MLESDNFWPHRLGEKAPGEEQCLSNLTFLEADLRGVDIAPGAVVVAVHACNDMNRLVIEAAAVADAAWCVLPAAQGPRLL